MRSVAKQLEAIFWFHESKYSGKLKPKTLELLKQLI